jgi:two-component system nitrate/nitrite response regulator NarL
MRSESSPPTTVLADDPLVARALLGSLAPWLDLVDVELGVVRVVDRPVGDAPGLPSVALVDPGSDPGPWFASGWAGVLDRTAPAERIAAAVRAVHLGLRVSEVRPVSPMPGPTPSSTPDLTPREIEVLELLAQGMSNKEIGDVLGISAHTAKFHVQGLLDKLDATTRTEAAVRAARLLLV